MNVKGIVWLGTRTAKFDEMLNMYHDVMGMPVTHQEPGFVVMELPNGDLVEIFADDSPHNIFFTHPVAGFLVDDIAAARAEMESQGIEFIGDTEVMEDGYAWSHFRAPDGFIYELTYSPKHPVLQV